MSIEDGLVMQFHVGAVRDHNPAVFERFGPDKGCDIPEASEFTHNLRPLLNKHGNDPRLTLILFCLDESTYARELAPLAGHYPALRLGPPWWFHDSINGIRRYFDRVMDARLERYHTGSCNFCNLLVRHIIKILHVKDQSLLVGKCHERQLQLFLDLVAT